MSIASSVVLAVVVSTIIIAVAWVLQQRPGPYTSVRHPSRLGVILATIYLTLWLTSLLIWRGAEGFGIAAILWGTPWSILSAFILNGLLRVRDGLFGTSWEVTITTLSIIGVGLNVLLLYRCGCKLDTHKRTLPTAQKQP